MNDVPGSHDDAATVEAAIARFMATQPVLEGMLPAIVDTLNYPMSSEQRCRLLEVVGSRGYASIFEGKIRASLRRWLTLEEINALTLYFASVPNEVRQGLFKLVFALNWARVEIHDYVHEECERIVGSE
jgi:hypothetical protein